MVANEMMMVDCAAVAESASVGNANVTTVKVVALTQVPIANALSANVENLRMIKFVPESDIVNATNVYVLLPIQVIVCSIPN